MSAHTTVLTNLLAALLSEAELRRLFAELGLGHELPGIGVTHIELCHQAAALLIRRGQADQDFFQRLADRAGGNFPRVVEVAAAMGVSGLHEGPARPEPSPAAPLGNTELLPGTATGPMSVPLWRRPAMVAVVAIVAGYCAFVYWRQAPPCASLDETLTEAGFSPNPGLSARMMPGTVLRVCGQDSSGIKRLASPVVWATAADCFSDTQVQDDNWEVPTHTCGSGMELSLEATDLARWLPGLSAHADALRDASLNLVNPRLKSLPEMTLGSGFSPACAEKLAAALLPPVQASWYQVVREAIVVDGLRFRVRWKGGVGAEARLTAEEEAVEGAKTGGLQLKADTHSDDETVWEAEGPLVIGWRGATARPTLAGGAMGSGASGGCL